LELGYHVAGTKYLEPSCTGLVQSRNLHIKDLLMTTLYHTLLPNA